jgi:hypothetical protein
MFLAMGRIFIALPDVNIAAAVAVRSGAASYNNTLSHF